MNKTHPSPLRQGMPELADPLMVQAMSCWSRGAAFSLRAMFIWPLAWIAFQQEMRDAWIARWGGGVPLGG